MGKFYAYETATAATGQRAFVSGHSLGGVLAQRVAVDRPNLVSKIFTKGSPMLEAGAVDERTDRRHIKVMHDIDSGDLMVPKVGGGRLGTLNRGRLFDSGNENTQEVFVRRGGGHTSKMGNDLCMRGQFFHYRKLTHSQWQSRNGFFSDLFNFVRPRINLV